MQRRARKPGVMESLAMLSKTVLTARPGDRAMRLSSRHL